ncbi:MAG: HD domain-containing protein [Candidatus Diapherotrites archaeon]
MNELIDFILQVENLKEEKRKGWKLRKVKSPESVADHSFAVTFLTLILAENSKQKLNKQKLLELAIIHDIAESICGDITPWDKNAKYKSEIEDSAMQELTQHLPPKLKKKILTLWNEYEEEKTKEAKFVKEIDRLEVFFQAYKYEKQNKGEKNLFEKFPIWKSQIKTKELKEIYNELKKKRKRN